MKKMLLVLFLIPAVVITYAQQNVLVSDSTYISGGTQSIPQLEDLAFYQYDSACRKSAKQSKIVTPFTGDVRNYQQQLYNYDTAGNLYQYISQDWSDTSYVNDERTTYTYNAAGRINSGLQEVWTDSSFWQPQYSTSTTYDTTGNITGQITQNRDFNAMKLVNSYQSKFEFNSSGKDTAAISLNWNETTQMWVPYNQTLSYYNENGFLIKTEQQQWNTSTSTWQPQTDITYYNNSKGQVDSSIQTSFTDTNTVFKTYYLYDSVTSATIQSDFYYYYGSQLVQGSRNLYSHLVTENSYSDTTFYETLVADTFVVSYQFALTVIYNTDSTPKEVIASYDWDDDNIPFVADDHYTYAPCQSVLPVSLLSFTGRQKNNDALLQWQTTNEVNTSYFVVQRSVDGIHFTPVGRVTATGNSSAAKNYSYTDRNIISLAVPTLYYRLVTTDKDGSVSYSKIAELNIATGKLTIQVSPNPVADGLSVYSPVSLPGAVVKIWDMSGRLLYASQQNITAGNKLAIDVSAFAKGMYIVSVQSAAGKYECKIVK